MSTGDPLFFKADYGTPASGGSFIVTDGKYELEKRVEQLERNVEDLLAIVERMQDERERIEITYGLKAGEGQTAANVSIAGL